MFEENISPNKGFIFFLNQFSGRYRYNNMTFVSVLEIHYYRQSILSINISFGHIFI